MKVIDDKGRLFGKINMIDFLVLLFLLCLTPMFYFGYKLYVGNKKATAELRLQEEMAKQATVDIQKADRQKKEFIGIPHISKENTEKEEVKPTPEKKTETETSLLLTSQLNDIINRIANLEDLKNRIANLEDLKNRITNLEDLKNRIANLEDLKNRIATLEEKLNIILSSPKIRKFKKQ